MRVSNRSEIRDGKRKYGLTESFSKDIMQNKMKATSKSRSMSMKRGNQPVMQNNSSVPSRKKRKCFGSKGCKVLGST